MRAPLQNVAPMVGESMTAPMLRTWASFVAQKESKVPQEGRPLPHPDKSRDNREREPRSSQLHRRSPLLRVEAMRSPSTVTRRLHVAAGSHRRRTATRYRSHEGIEGQHINRGSRYHRSRQPTPPKGRRRHQEENHLHRGASPRDSQIGRLILRPSPRGISHTVGTISNQSLLIQMWDWRRTHSTSR